VKKTTRDNWRVVAVIHPTKTHMPIDSLGFTDKWGGPLGGQVWGAPFELTVLPQRLGDIGGIISMSDRLASDDIEGDYHKRCEVLRDGLLQHPNVVEARIECDEEHRCSHCGYTWEELTPEDVVDFTNLIDQHSIPGEPVCCDKAIEEFRTERGIPQPSRST
jgi:hypothetical protein